MDNDYFVGQTFDYKQVIDPSYELLSERVVKKLGKNKFNSVEFQYQGNFTLAVLTVGKEHFVGVTKRMPKDEENYIRANQTALARAISNWFQEKNL